MDLTSARRLLEPSLLPLPWTAIEALRQRPPRSVRFESLWVKPGRHFNVSYRLTDERGDTALASAFLLDEGRAAQVVERARRRGEARGSVLARTAHVGGGILLQLFPCDYRLPTLAQCLDTSRVSSAVGMALAAAAPSGYRPGMRCQIRYEEAGGGAVFGKVAVEASEGGLSQRQAAIFAAARRRGDFHVPEPLAYAADLHLSLVRSAGGDSLHHLLSIGEIGTPWREIGASLSAFHRQDTPATRIYGPGDELELLGGWVALVAALYPPLAPVLNAAGERLRRTAPAASPGSAFVHRDFYDKQVLRTAEGWTFLDLDTACRGDAEIDLGNFCAHLVLRGLQWSRGDAHGALEAAFVDAYPGAIDRLRFDWYRRAALLRLACGYALRPHWRHLAPPLAKEALR